MRFRYAGRLGLASLLFLFSCNNYIIERSASDYFPYQEGNWWRYSNGALYEPHILLVEVEPKDTILQQECYPVSFSGNVRYFQKSKKAINKYIKIVHHISGEEYTIIQGFVKRIELPLVAGNSYRDSLGDSLELFGDVIKGKYSIHGLISEYEYDDLYGSLYKIVLTTTETLILPDTTIINTNYLEEYYAPNIGLVRFHGEEGEYNLIEYEVQ